MNQRSEATRFDRLLLTSARKTPPGRTVVLMGLSAAFIATGVLITACAGPADRESAAGNAGHIHVAPDRSSDQSVVLEGSPSAEQLEAVQDFNVSSDENQKGYQLYEECLADAGFIILENAPRGALLDFAIPDAAVTSGADAICYDRHFKQIDMMWQQQNAGDSETVALIRDCLQAHGVVPSDDVAQIEDQLRYIGVDPSDCVTGP